MITANNAASPATWNYLPMAFAALLAIATPWSALDCAGRAFAAAGRQRTLWLIAGFIAPGIGLEAFHLSAMIAMRLPVSVRYQGPTLAMALLAGMLSSGLLLYAACALKPDQARAFIDSVTAGIGIAAQHYIGLASIRMGAALRFNFLFAAVSVLPAIASSWILLSSGFDLREDTPGQLSRKIRGSLLSGAGLAAMHYTSMAATGFTASAAPPDFSRTAISSADAIGISILALAILGLTSSAAAADRRFRAQGLRLALAESNVALSEAARQSALSDVSASIVHEIRQPLAVVVTEVSASLRWLAHAPPDLPEARESLARAIQNANRASEVAGRIGALLRKTPPRLMRLDAGEIILEALHLARGTLVERGVSVKTDLAADAPMAIGDRIQLQQLVLNLIMNAVEAMSTVTDRPRELFLRLSANSYELFVQVQDSGRGLDPEHASHIFDPFFSTKPHGIGMGLSLCRSIVQAHGGRLWAEPGSPGGTIFQFTLRKAEKQHG